MLCWPRFRMPTPHQPVPNSPFNYGEAFWGRSSARRLAVAAIIFAALLIVFWLIARFFHLTATIEYPVSTFLSFALLFAPYWFFGFGLADSVCKALPDRLSRIACSVLLAAPYFVLTIPR